MARPWRRPALAVLALASVVRGGDLDRNYTDSATALHAHLLAGYNKIIPPQSTRRTDAALSSKAGTDVGVSIKFLKMQSVSQAAGRMQLKVWYRLRWVDDRLAWDPAAHSGITSLPFLGQ